MGIVAIYFLPWYEDPVYYGNVYGIEGFFDILMSAVHWMTAAFGALTAVLILIARRVEAAAERSLTADSQCRVRH